MSIILVFGDVRAERAGTGRALFLGHGLTRINTDKKNRLKRYAQKNYASHPG